MYGIFATIKSIVNEIFLYFPDFCDVYCSDEKVTEDDDARLKS